MAQAVRVHGAEPAARAASLWILDPGRDLLLFIATPLVILPVVALLQLGLSVADIALYVGAFGALGHHLPGLMRAYGDRELFRRFRVRFVVAPVFFVTVGVFFAHRDLNGLIVITLLWGIWHGLAQVYGFCRIYDAKVGEASPWTPHLDRWMCILWFGAGVLHSPDRMARIAGDFYTAGGPILPPGGFGAFLTAWTAATAVVTVAFLAHLFWRSAHGRPPSTAKLLVMGSSIAFWWYATAGLDNAILGVALFEMFHDVQYLAITWVYNRGSVEKHRDVGPFTRFLFRPKGALVGLYVALVFAYGGASLFNSGDRSEIVRTTLIGLISASTFLHFYYDAFIWKVREKTTRDGLGVAGGERGVRPEQVRARLAQAARWGLFLIPAVWLGAAQLRGAQPGPLERMESLVGLAPTNARARVELGKLLLNEGRLPEAAEQYRAALQLDPTDAGAYTLLGDVYRTQEDWMRAGESYARALRVDPNRADALRGLGLVQHHLGDLSAAADSFEAALRLEPHSANVHSNLGAIRHAQGDLDAAARHYRSAIAADGDLAEPHNNLGVLLEDRGELDEALVHFEAAARLGSNPTTRENLERVRAALPR